MAHTIYSDTAKAALALVLSLSACSVASPIEPEPVPDREHVAALATASTVRIDSLVGAGTGWVIDEGKIMTAAHVLRPWLAVTALHDGLECDEIGRWVDEERDLAIVEVEDCDSLMPLRVAPSAPLPGSDVVLVGHPFGVEWSVVTLGIVSSVKAKSGGQTVLQVDAAANPGMSGGPVMDEHGRVVGTITSIFTRDGLFAGTTYAVPMWPAQD